MPLALRIERSRSKPVSPPNGKFRALASDGESWRKARAMSYPMDLDEYKTSVLRAELARREALRLKGMCDYCGKKISDTPGCKESERHAGKAT